LLEYIKLRGHFFKVNRALEYQLVVIDRSK